ncbi:hypothetical protein AL755_21355 [Arthrobacter sp. ERGS1:01]|uniref:hypothetical protein n=1 Tax=Arthrobacter sp. ERGS1:01 TaxID=1704044 RepID=UPI0006B4EE48|nr:hypothetical protein [Arthrobacter sp. ERGS1:01]ALE07433.1 hypothetical protein AL755_21355 [Arthrobacter sp. ERGS1:01]
MEIHLWWLELDMGAKEWLRENADADVLPDHVAAAVLAAGGEMANGTLTRREWDFIETQSEFVD